MPLARAKVLLVLQTKALYASIPCLKEIHTALQNGVRIIPVRLELGLPRAAEQWPQLAGSTNIEDIMMKTEVQEGLNKLNSVEQKMAHQMTNEELKVGGAEVGDEETV